MKPALLLSALVLLALLCSYGARGTYRMKGTHRYEFRGGEWIAVNG